ncbi:hypothetical protein DBV15_06690 [Temnothorax longispinosus]|uniref:Uncharacterized protein n=1 Tax=Temnothorax longispinosus TaxID=300112 RepID=A0A4V3SC68_9HYME|nr:hypothetical protein DBV15_06690 [Temnothorax longispinosus]
MASHDSDVTARPRRGGDEPSVSESKEARPGSEAELVRQRHNICALGETSGARVLHATASSCSEEETWGNGVSSSVGGEVRAGAGGEGDVYAIKYKV